MISPEDYKSIEPDLSKAKRNSRFSFATIKYIFWFLTGLFFLTTGLLNSNELTRMLISAFSVLLMVLGAYKFVSRWRKPPLSTKYYEADFEKDLKAIEMWTKIPPTTEEPK